MCDAPSFPTRLAFFYNLRSAAAGSECSDDAKEGRANHFRKEEAIPHTHPSFTTYLALPRIAAESCNERAD